MKPTLPRRFVRTPAARQRGLTLIELSITMVLALFLLAGLLTILQNTRNAYANENKLSQLQDAERLALTIMTDVIQSAGYYPNPALFSADLSLPAVGSFPAAGSFQVLQGITGTHSTSAPGDSVTVRFTTFPADGILDCIGETNTGASNQTYVNIFKVVNDQLACSVDGGTTFTGLVGGGGNFKVQNLDVSYGVRQGGVGNDNSINRYLHADAMGAADWLAVGAVKIALTFTNPVPGPGGTPATIRLERVIAVMNRAGVTT